MEKTTARVPSEGGLIIRNATGTSLILEARFAEEPPPRAFEGGKDVLQPSRPVIATEKFVDYCKKIDGWKIDIPVAEDQDKFLRKVLEKAQTILNDFHAGKVGHIRDVFDAKEMLDKLADIAAKTLDGEQKLRNAEFEKLSGQYAQLLQRHS
jgi:hypothetical protein